MTFIQPPIELTLRESEIVELLTSGLTNQEIANRTGLTLHTIKWYMKQIFGKLDASNRAQAVATVIEMGLLDQPTTRTTHHLPSALTPFISREDEIKRLEAILLEEGARLITIHGAGGMGKTRLTLELAHRLQTHYSAGVYFVSLAHTHRNPLIEIAETLNIQSDAGANRIDEISEFLHNRQCLLILDTFEHLTDYAVQVTELLQRASQLQILITSREVLRVHGEVVFLLQGLTLPTPNNHPETSGAYQLFLQSARSAYADFEPTRPDQSAIHDICQLVDGMPLAIELAAGWSSVLSVQETRDRLKASLDLLNSNEQNRPERHQSIRATFDYSWSMLSPEAQAVLISLAVFPQKGFTFQSAEKIVGLSPAIMKQLVDAALLQRRSHHSFAFHPLIHQYSMERLQANPDLLRDVQRKHGQYYLDFVMDHINALRATLSPDIVKSFKEEMFNLYQAWDFALQNGRYDWLVEAAEVGYLCDLGDLWKACNQLFEMTLHALPPDDLQTLRGRLIAFRAIFSFRMTDFETLAQYAANSWEMLEGTPHVGDAATAMIFHAMACALQGDLTQSLHIMDKLEPLHHTPERIQSSYTRLYLQWGRGIVMLLGGQAENAIRHFDTLPHIAWHDVSLYRAEAYLELGQIAEATAHLNEVYDATLEEHKYQSAIASAFYLATLETPPQKLTDAIARTFTEIAYISDTPLLIAHLVQYFGRYQLARGRHDHASQIFRSNLTMLGNLGATAQIYRYTLSTATALMTIAPQQALSLLETLCDDSDCPAKIRQQATEYIRQLSADA